VPILPTVGWFLALRGLDDHGETRFWIIEQKSSTEPPAAQ
jgi:hypothetical protein